MPANSKIRENFRGVIDSTLREGEQFAFSDFSFSERRFIFRMLTKIGVDRIEVGNPLTPGIKEEIKNYVKEKNSPPILAHVRNRLEDVRAAIDLGVSGVNILCNIDEERLASMRITFDDYAEDLAKAVSLIKQMGLEARVSVENYWQQDTQKAMRLFGLADSLGVNRIGVADTLGIATPWEVTGEIKRIRKEIKAEIEVHFHNDTGCALVNALEALEAGAHWVDTTLLGIGERTGIVPLSLFLLRLYTISPELVKDYQLEFLTEAEGQLAKILGIKVPFNLITNRETAFSHKAGIHINALINNGSRHYELVSPKLIGGQRRILNGTRISGKTTQDQVERFFRKFGKD